MSNETKTVHYDDDGKVRVDGYIDRSNPVVQQLEHVLDQIGAQATNAGMENYEVAVVMIATGIAQLLGQGATRESIVEQCTELANGIQVARTQDPPVVPPRGEPS